MAGGEEFFRYTDAGGVMHIVDSLEKVPPEKRESVEKLMLEKSSQMINKAKAAIEARSKDDIPFLSDVHGPSFLFGVVLALGLMTVFKVVWGGMKTLFKLAITVAVVVALSGMYFGWVKEGGSPKELVEDAKKAASAAQKKIEEEKANLKKAEERAK
jgi:hypothetical protein